MSFRNLIVTIILGVIILCAIAGEGYFYFYSQKQNNAANAIVQSIQNTLKTKQPYDALAEAKNNLQAQTERLNQMQASFPSSPLLDAAIKKDVVAAALAAAKANTLAADPKLGISTKANIITLGQKATQALAYLQSLAKTSASTVALNDAAQNAVDLVAAYSNEIYTYINSLTPANSSLMASEIADYKAQVNNIVAEINSTKDSLNQIDNIPASSVVGTTSDNGQLSISNDQGNSTTTTSQAPDSKLQVPNNNQIPSNNNQNNDQVNTNQGGNSGSGGVTLGDIVAEQNIVTQTTDQVNQLGDQVTGEATSTSDSSSDSSSDNGDNSNDSNNAYTGGDNNGGGNNSGSSQNQNGQVRLIEGENTF